MTMKLKLNFIHAICFCSMMHVYSGMTEKVLDFVKYINLQNNYKLACFVLVLPCIKTGGHLFRTYKKKKILHNNKKLGMQLDNDLRAFIMQESKNSAIEKLLLELNCVVLPKYGKDGSEIFFKENRKKIEEEIKNRPPQEARLNSLLEEDQVQPMEQKFDYPGKNEFTGLINLLNGKPELQKQFKLLNDIFINKLGEGYFIPQELESYPALKKIVEEYTRILGLEIQEEFDHILQPSSFVPFFALSKCRYFSDYFVNIISAEVLTLMVYFYVYWKITGNKLSENIDLFSLAIIAGVFSGFFSRHHQQLEDQKKQLENKNKILENQNKILENKNKILEDKNKILEDKNKQPEEEEEEEGDRGSGKNE